MERFSVVISNFGWSVKSLMDGKELSGAIEDIPNDAYHDLLERVDMSDASVCTATQIETEPNSPFSTWFRVTHRWLIPQQ